MAKVSAVVAQPEPTSRIDQLRKTLKDQMDAAKDRATEAQRFNGICDKLEAELVENRAICRTLAADMERDAEKEKALKSELSSLEEALNLGVSGEGGEENMETDQAKESDEFGPLNVEVGGESAGVEEEKEQPKEGNEQEPSTSEVVQEGADEVSGKEQDGEGNLWGPLL